ncbi:hypothetical protein P9112_011826 [Eukaryota sp. TZLM1-RC]
MDVDSIINSLDFKRRLDGFPLDIQPNIVALISAVLRFSTQTISDENALLRSELDRSHQNYAACERTLSRLQSHHKAREEESQQAIEAAQSLTQQYQSRLQLTESQLEETKSELSKSQVLFSSRSSAIPAETPSVIEMYHQLQDAQNLAKKEQLEREKLETYLQEIHKVLEEKQPALTLLQESWSMSEVTQKAMSSRLRESLEVEQESSKLKATVHNQSKVIEKLKQQNAQLLARSEGKSTDDSAVVFSDYKQLIDRNVELMKKVEELNSDLSASQDLQTIADLQQYVHEQQVLIDHLKEDRDALANKLKVQEGLLKSSNYDPSKTRYGEQISVASPYTVQLEQKVHSLELNITELVSRNNSLIESLDHLRQSLHDVRSESGELRQQNSTLRNDLTTSHGEYQTLMAQFNEIIRTKSETDGELNQSKRELGVVNAELDHYKSLCVQLSDSSSQLNSKISELETRLQKEINRAQASSSSLVSALDDNQKLKDYVSTQSKEIDSLKNEVFELKTGKQPPVVQDLEENIINLTKTIEEKETLLTELQSKLLEAHKKEEILSKSVEDSSNKVKHLTFVIETLKATQGDSQLNIDSLSAQIHQLSRGKNDLELRIEGLLKEIESKNAFISKLTEQVSTLSAENRSLEQLVEKQKIDFKEIEHLHERESKNKEISIEKLNQSLSLSESSITRLETELQTVKKERETLLNRLSDHSISEPFQESLSFHEKEREAFRTEVERWYTEFSAIKHNYALLESELLNMKSQIITSEFDSQKSTLLEEKNKQLEEEIQRLSGQVSEFSTKVQQLNADVEQLSAQNLTLVSEKEHAIDMEQKLSKALTTVNENGKKWKERAKLAEQQLEGHSAKKKGDLNDVLQMKKEIQLLEQYILKFKHYLKLKQNLVGILRSRITQLKEEKDKASTEPESAVGFVFDAPPPSWPVNHHSSSNSSVPGGFVFEEANGEAAMEGVLVEENVKEEKEHGFFFDAKPLLSAGTVPESEMLPLLAEGFTYPTSPVSFSFCPDSLSDAIPCSPQEPDVDNVGFIYRTINPFKYEPTVLDATTVAPIEPTYFSGGFVFGE